MIIKVGQEIVYFSKDRETSVSFIYVTDDKDNKDTLIFIRTEALRNFFLQRFPLQPNDIWKITKDFLDRNVDEGHIRLKSVIDIVSDYSKYF